METLRKFMTWFAGLSSIEAIAFGVIIGTMLVFITWIIR